jgi:hypothetical protein
MGTELLHPIKLSISRLVARYSYSLSQNLSPTGDPPDRVINLEHEAEGGGIDAAEAQAGHAEKDVEGGDGRRLGPREEGDILVKILFMSLFPLARSGALGIYMFIRLK